MTKYNPGTPKNYAAAVDKMLRAGHTVEELNTANHMALEKGIITLEHFRAAAKVLVAHIIKG